MTDLLLRQFPPLPLNSQTPQAIVLRDNYVYDPKAPQVPQAIRGSISKSVDKDGKLYLYKNEEGFLYNKSPKGGWGLVLFIRDGIHLHVVLPLSHMIIGKNFRTLLEKQRDHQPSLATIVSSISTQHGAVKFERFIRTFWNTIRQDKNTLIQLKLDSDRYNGIFLDPDFNSNIDNISVGLVPEARQFLRGGSFRLQDLLRLPDATGHARQGQYIYIWVYTHLDGTNDIGLYVGQTCRIRDRIRVHQRDTTDGRHSPHYHIARRAQPNDRRVFVLCFWDDQNPKSQAALDMAEQTMMVVLDSYHRWMVSSNLELFRNSDSLVFHDQCTYLRSVARQIREEIGWKHDLDVVSRGCNVISPLFNSMSPPIIECFRTTALNSYRRSFTTYRKYCKFNHDPKRDTQMIVNLSYNNGVDKSRPMPFRFDKGCFQRFTPKSGFVIFEIMDDDQPHDNPWFGSPSVGPFKNFDQVSSMGIRIEWFVETTNEWATVPISQTNTFSTVDSLLRGWKKALTAIQLLKGITWSGPLTGPLDGLCRSPNFGSRRVSELTIDHLQQTCQWTPRQGKVLPAPALATWNENFLLMADQFGKNGTVICRQRPPSGDDFWLGKKKSPLQNLCDFCKYRPRQKTRTCERDTSRPDIWVCKPCSEMNRPCTFTPIGIASEAWGTDPPLSNNSCFSLFPTGPHRKLAFHRTIPLEKRITPIIIREPFCAQANEIIAELQEDEETDVGDVALDIDEDEDED